MAVDELGGDVVAVTARSPLHTERELDDACRHAENMGVRHLVVDTNELEEAEIRGNPPDRCYLCKKDRFQRMVDLAGELQLKTVLDGTNADDLSMYRPGLRAARECGVRSPLAESGLSKEEIRGMSRRLDLPSWDKPSLSCLATRIPHGEELTPEKLAAVKCAEDVLQGYGIRQARVRHHGDIARIEVPPTDFSTLVAHAAEIAAKVAACGYRFVTLDLQGYRSGSMDTPGLGGGSGGPA
jgi:uncharacterized protein